MDIGSREFKEYVTRMKEIRFLSTPDLQKIENADEYSSILLENFSLIGELSAKNRLIINEFIKPNLASDTVLSDDIRKKLEEFSELLFDVDTFGEVDIHLSNLIVNRLMDEEIRISADNDINEHVIAIAKKVKRDYLLLSGLTRFYTDQTDEIRKKAIENRNELGKFLKKECFATLNSEARRNLLQFSLMGALLFESTQNEMPVEFWEECIDILEEAAKIFNDRFYRDLEPDYDWESYEFRIYYYGSFLAYSILPASIAAKAYDYAVKAIDFLDSHDRKDFIAAVSPEQENVLKLLAAVQAGLMDPHDACDFLYDAYEKRDTFDYSVSGINQNLDTPATYLIISKVSDMELSDKDVARYNVIESSVIDYLHRIPKSSDTYLKLVTLITNFPMYFREVSGAMSMEEFCLKAFAAIHPPTYIHVNMVADLTESLVRHLFETDPAQFIGFPGCKTLDEVLASRDRITDFAYHAALCHDIGKLFIIDVISMYGRNLLDDEFEFIKNHPVIGALVAKDHASTRDYADIILGHHLWYDCSRGYPAGTDTFSSPYKTIIDIVLAADCLDAATDTVGRSYNKGKTFSDYEKEIIDGAGTHYAPFLPILFNNPDVRQDVEYLLDERRKKLYRDTFLILKNNEIGCIKATRKEKTGDEQNDRR